MSFAMVSAALNHPIGLFTSLHSYCCFVNTLMYVVLFLDVSIVLAIQYINESDKPRLRLCISTIPCYLIWIKGSSNTLSVT
jgi:hypothetical membrane protein